MLKNHIGLFAHIGIFVLTTIKNMKLKKRNVNYFPYNIRLSALLCALINVPIWTHFVCLKFVKSNV